MESDLPALARQLSSKDRLPFYLNLIFQRIYCEEKTMKQAFWLTFACITLLLAACSITPVKDSEVIVQTIVSSTLTAQPTKAPLDTPTLHTSVPTATIPSPTPTLLDQIGGENIYQVVTVPNPQSEVLTDIYIRNIETGDEIFFDVSRKHICRTLS
jgi:predicted neutral ceramidase superfamily lipid hydrolase